MKISLKQVTITSVCALGLLFIAATEPPSNIQNPSFRSVPIREYYSLDNGNNHKKYLIIIECNERQNAHILLKARDNNFKERWIQSKVQNWYLIEYLLPNEETIWGDDVMELFFKATPEQRNRALEAMRGR